jgi:hypothetical protein
MEAVRRLSKHWLLMGRILRPHAERVDTVTKERFLTVRWNDLLSLGLGIPSLKQPAQYESFPFRIP